MEVISSTQDFFGCMCPKVQELILSHLEMRDLLACCCVNRTWSSSVSSCKGIWFDACRKIGLIVENERARSPEGWKRFLLEMTARKRQMLHDPQCFVGHVVHAPSLTICAVDYQDGTIALCSDSHKIMLCNHENVCYQTIWLTWSPISVKLSGKFLFAASDAGDMVCLETESATSVFRERNEITLTAYDLLGGYGILATAFQDLSIVVWNIMFGTRQWSAKDHTSKIEKIVLSQKRCLERQASLWLFTMDRDFIFVRMVFYETRGSLRNGFLSITAHTIPLTRSELPTVQRDRFTIPSLVFHGKFLYFTRPNENVICKWDLEEVCVFSETRLDAKVQTLLGVGNKYLAFIGTESGAAEHYFLAIDLEKKEVVVERDLTEILRSSPAGAKNSMCIGDRDWLNGLDGENDRGPVFVCARHNRPPYLLKWSPRNR